MDCDGRFISPKPSTAKVMEGCSIWLTAMSVLPALVACLSIWVLIIAIRTWLPVWAWRTNSTTRRSSVWVMAVASTLECLVQSSATRLLKTCRYWQANSSTLRAPRRACLHWRKAPRRPLQSSFQRTACSVCQMGSTVVLARSESAFQRLMLTT